MSTDPSGQPRDTLNERLETLREILHGPPAEDTWETLRAAIDAWTGQSHLTLLLEYADGHLAQWPDPMRRFAPPIFEPPAQNAPLPASLALSRHLRLSARLRGWSSAQAQRLFHDRLTYVDLSDNHLHVMGALGMKRLLAALPASVSVLDLDENDLGKIGAAGLIDALAALPSTLHTLDLSESPIVGDPSLMKRLINALPPNLHKLALRKHMLHRFGAEELRGLFEGLPSSLHTLDLSYNGLHKLGAVGLAQALTGLSPQLQRLHLNDNHLHEMAQATGWWSALTRGGLDAVFRALPAELQWVSLNNNELHRAVGAPMVRALKALPPRLHTIHFNGNEFGRSAPRALEKTFRAFPPQVQSVALRFNALGTLSTTQLNKALQALPTSVRRLDLSFNHFKIPPSGAAHVKLVGVEGAV